MNKTAEQAKFVQDALRAGKKVAVATPRERLFERVVGDMIPEDLEIASRTIDRHSFKFKNGATLTFIAASQGDRSGVRGTYFDAALYYPSLFGEPIERERMEECYEILRAHAAEMRELEMP